MSTPKPAAEPKPSAPRDPLVIRDLEFLGGNFNVMPVEFLRENNESDSPGLRLLKESLRKALEANPTEPELLAYIAELETQSLGITPELQISPAQLSDLNPQRRVTLATYIFSGAISFMALSALGVLFFGTGRRA